MNQSEINNQKEILEELKKNKGDLEEDIQLLYEFKRRIKSEAINNKLSSAISSAKYVLTSWNRCIEKTESKLEKLMNVYSDEQITQLKNRILRYTDKIQKDKSYLITLERAMKEVTDEQTKQGLADIIRSTECRIETYSMELEKLKEHSKINFQ